MYSVNGNVSVVGAMRLVDTTWEPLDHAMEGVVMPYVHTLATFQDKLIAGIAGFDFGVRAWNGSRWQALGQGLVIDSVRAFTAHDGDLIAAGEDAAGVDHLARLRSGAWSPLGLGTNWPVHALVSISSQLVAGGSFTQADGAAAARVVLWDGVGWSQLGQGWYDSAAAVNALIAWDDSVIAAGGYSPQQSRTVSRWDGEEWSSLGSPPVARVDGATSFAVYDEQLIVAGTFAAGFVFSHIHRFDGANWHMIGQAGGGDYPYHSPVYALAVYNGGL